MEILKACFSFYRITRDVVSLSDEAKKSYFYDTLVVEKIQKSLSDLRKMVEVLKQWQIQPKVFEFTKESSEQQMVEAAKELIEAVYRGIDKKGSLIKQKSFAGSLIALAEEEKEDYVADFMEQYLNAASIVPCKLDEEAKNLLIYAFKIDKDDISDRLRSLENVTQYLLEKRDAFITAAVSWRRGTPDDNDRAEPVKIEEDENGQCEDSDGENKGESEDNKCEEGNAEVENEECEEGNVGVEKGECEEGNAEVEKGECEEIDSETESVEMPDDVFESYIYDKFRQIMESSREPGGKDEELLGVDEKNTEGDEEATIEEDVAEEAEDGEIQEIWPEVGGQEEHEEKADQVMQTAIKNEVRDEKVEIVIHQLKNEECIEDLSVCDKLDDFQIECLRLLQKRVHLLQSGEEPNSSDNSEEKRICWRMLEKGEAVLAEEISAVFYETSTGNCVNPAVIGVVGSGLFMPVTDEDTQKYFQFHQPLLQFDKLDRWEQTAVTLAALPAAHCCYDIRLDDIMLQVLPDAFRKWADVLIRRRKEMTYIDRTVIESYRRYQSRVKKIQEIQQKARVQFEGLQNSNLPYRCAAKILTATCSKERYIGTLWDLMNEVEPEVLAAGIADPKVEELYSKGRAIIPEKKNTSKSIDAGLIDRIIEEGRKRYGYSTEIVGSSRHKMVQMLRDFLITVNEWLKLISIPCMNNPYDISFQFIQNLSECYQSYREELYLEASEQTEEPYLPEIYYDTLRVMDYLMGLQEDVPPGWKSYLEHALRLCAIPNLYVRESKMGICQCEYPDPIERLYFLKRIICSIPDSAEACLNRFIKADAFDGCRIILALLERTQPGDFIKIREHYERSVLNRLDILKAEIAQMRNDLYPLSVYARWLGNNYLSTLSMIAMLERKLEQQIMKEEQDNLAWFCASVKECQSNVEDLVQRFCEHLRNQVKGNFNEEQSDKLYDLIEKRQYAAVIEWTARLNISEGSVMEPDFFKERYFDDNLYNQKQKSLLQSSGFKNAANRLENALMKSISWEGFDFNRVPGSIGNRRSNLIRLWYKIKAEFYGITKSRIEENSEIFDDLKEMLKVIGWDVTELKGCDICEDESGSYIQFDMHFKPTYSRERCPIPLFGSDSDGRIRMICLYGSTNASDKQYDLFENKSQHLPMIILFFGVMTRNRRMELYNLALNKQSSFLVVDDMIITTICERRETMLLRWLYELAVPFSVQKLYTAALGVVHPEMFYGRVSAKNDLGLNGKVCAVYGGRQLGKTALLKNIESKSHNPEIDHYVYYISLPTVTVENPDVVLTKEIVNAVQNDIPLDRKCENMEGVLESVKGWVKKKETRRLLLLLDEADKFLQADGKSGFRITGIINRVMTVSSMHFKVVFAGLHNVYRAVSSPNNPLAHYGKPISIGPLLDDELQDAFNLIRQPFETMGYRFEDFNLIIRILAETNYYPSLIQLFCMKLQDYLHRPGRRRGNNLPVIINREDVDAVLTDQNLKKSICDRFMWTLDLDDRYKAIVLSIASDVGRALQTDSSSDFVKGYELEWIFQEMQLWPNLFKGNPSLDELRGLCDELIQLGILRSVSNDRYTLRSANVIDMLGTQESIVRNLYGLESKHYDYEKMYNGSLYRSIFQDRESGCKCYPLTNQQIHSALDTGGIKMIIGSHMLGIDKVEKCLRELLAIDKEEPHSYDLYQQKAYSLRTYHSGLPDLDDLGGGLSVHLIYWECAWELEDILCYKQRVDGLEEQDRPILLLLCDEERSRKLQESFLEDIFDVPIIKLATWDLEAVQFWLNELSAPPLLMEDLTQIMERLCGWPEAMYRLGQLITEHRQEPDFRTAGLLDQTVKSLAESSALSRFLPDESVEPLLRHILNLYVEYEAEMSCEDVQYLLEEEGEPHDMEDIEYAMVWMTDLGLLNRRIQDQDMNAGNEKKKYGVNILILELWKQQMSAA